MRPWTVDADDIRIAEDLDGHFVHRNAVIDDFLSINSEKFLVVATKGFGKTLLLKAKRISLQERGIRCLPESALIDKPVGDKIFSAQMIDLFGSSTENWRKVWLVAIGLAILKAHDMQDGLEGSPRLKSLLNNSNLTSAIDHFVTVLGLPRGELFRCAEDVETEIVPRLRRTGQPLALFIDSIDEYFNKHIVRGNSGDSGQTTPGVWYYSQMGLVEAAYQLRRVNHHIKVFAAVRKEAFDRFSGGTSMVQQYAGSAVDLTYSYQSLRDIFEKNILKEKTRNLADRSQLKENATAALTGLETLTHGYTGEEEETFDYLCRHTLRRPRDFMTLGQRLSGIRPSERNERTLKEAAHRAASEIALEYLTEIDPYVQGCVEAVASEPVNFEAVLAQIPSNVLKPTELKACLEDRDDSELIFSLLYSAGLLGVIEVDPITGSRVQSFLQPGDRCFDPEDKLPRSSYYLLHPALTEVITRLNPAYADGFDRTNIVGHRRPWVEPERERELCVLRADIVGFSKIMANGSEDIVSAAFHQAVSDHARSIIHWEINQGDSLTMVHDDVKLLVRAIRRIMEDLRDGPEEPLLRVAIDQGGVLLRREKGRLRPIGQPFLRAARIEPHVHPNAIWVTDSVATSKVLINRYRCVEIPSDPEQPDPEARNRSNIKKRGSSERDVWVKLYQLERCDHSA